MSSASKRIPPSSKKSPTQCGPISSSNWSFPLIPVPLLLLQVCCLFLLCPFPLAMSAPGIPASWERCPEAGGCQNGGICYSDGISEFCICDDGYGGQKCERLVDAIFFLDKPLSSEQLAHLCKIAFVLGICTFLAALLGWACCCLKHLNARRLYLQNVKLARENQLLHSGNQSLSKRTIRLYAALARAKGLIGAEEEANGPLMLISTDCEATTPTNELAGPIRPNRATSSDSHQNPSHRVLMRELSEMHDELRKSIEGEDRIVEILGREETTTCRERRGWWNWEKLRTRLNAIRSLLKEEEEDEEQRGQAVGRNTEDEQQPLKSPSRRHQQQQDNHQHSQSARGEQQLMLA